MPWRDSVSTLAVDNSYAKALADNLWNENIPNRISVEIIIRKLRVVFNVDAVHSLKVGDEDTKLLAIFDLANL